ncbi:MULTISPECIES: DUF4235 domain-containing protein [unclassified Streptomyces]|uniref:DUF4235 domain-containing protein n=1 Tax=unclassified Streptomyces TaxID=2593676 RepID=UPI0022B70070|nr:MULTISPECIES: DUF4235 domain-containing protein [unclassified Streptomyces]MCZ7412980.1 DUF4235 domain-containing protein [Streptomyces sp. WMMC897]MCZ7434711.1 DUF4235 domain-containing protein [Streptomyces sp. WMMC1477]
MASRVGGLAVTVVGGAVTGAVFRRVWRAVAGEDEAPDARDVERSWREVLLAAALHGALLALVKAALQRGGALGARRVTARRAA